MVKNYFHVIGMLSFPIQPPNELKEFPFPPPMGELARTDILLIYSSGQPFQHMWEGITHRAFLSCCLFLTQVSNALAGESASLSWSWVLAFVSQYMCHHPHAKAPKKASCALEDGSCHFLWEKRQLRNLLAIASAFPLENKRESWRATEFRPEEQTI